MNQSFAIQKETTSCGRPAEHQMHSSSCVARDHGIQIYRSKNNNFRTNKRTSLLCLKMATDLPNLKGQLYIRGGPEYEENRCRNFARNAHNRDNNTKEKDNHQPAYIAVCEVVEDVQASIKFAQSNNLTVTVRTGGHNWFGCFLRNDVFLIDMQKFNQLNIDSSSSIARAGPAVVGTDLNDKAEVHGLCFPSGHCPGVPIGGFLLGGGYGWFFPYYGYAAEYIEEVTLVTPKGEIVTAKEGDDWLWMARGSASAFPGVVVEYKLRLAPLPKIIRMKTEFFPIVSYETVVRFANEYITKHSGESQKLELTVNLASTPPPMAEVVKAPKVFMVTQTWMADSEEDFHNQVAPLMTDKFPVKPLVAGEFQDFSSFSGLSSILGPAYPSGQHWISRALEYRANTFQDVAWENVQQEFVDKAPL